jgi:sugar/nucleoside kinase (ribokinase family)
VPDFDLLVLGDINPDLVLRGDVEPAFGQVEKLVDDAELLIGGSGAIVACGAARLGVRTAIAGVVGDDLFGRFMLDAFPGERWDGGLRELLPLTDLFLPNGEEVTRIAGRDDPGDAARVLAAEGPLVAVKLGADGALAANGDELIQVSAPTGVDPVDTTGAGDSFDAGVLASLLQGWPPERMLELGCACGALSTRAAGGTAAQPTLEEALA